MREDNAQKKVNEKVQVEKVVPEGQDENAGPRHAIAEPLRSQRVRATGGWLDPKPLILYKYICFCWDHVFFGG